VTSAAGLVHVAAPGVLAHQGGWDEALMLLGPVVLFVGLVITARRRQKADADPPDDQGPGH